MNASPAPQIQIATQPEPSAAVAKFLKRAPRLFIGGEWVESQSTERIAVIDPATGRQIASVADTNAADVDRAVAAARKAFESGPWPDMLPADRQALLWKLSDLIEKNMDELAELESLDNGKTKFMATVVDVTGTRDYFRYVAGWARARTRSRRFVHTSSIARTSTLPRIESNPNSRYARALARRTLRP